MKFLLMSRRLSQSTVLLIGLGLLFTGSLWGQPVPAKGHPDSSGWKNLFEPDLSNATMNPGGWVMEKGELSAKNGETIWTKESYANFVLDLEFKVSKEANSGVFLRSSDIKNVLAALEIQVHESTDGTKYGMVGAI